MVVYVAKRMSPSYCSVMDCRVCGGIEWFCGVQRAESTLPAVLCRCLGPLGLNSGHGHVSREHVMAATGRSVEQSSRLSVSVPYSPACHCALISILVTRQRDQPGVNLLVSHPPRRAPRHIDFSTGGGAGPVEMFLYELRLESSVGLRWFADWEMSGDGCSTGYWRSVGRALCCARC